MCTHHIAFAHACAPWTVSPENAGASRLPNGVAQAAAAGSALVTGFVYDRWGARVLLSLPPLVALVPLLAFSGQLWVVVVGILVWGAATGVQDSTVKALVAEVVAPARRASAYGVFAGVQGAFAVVGGLVAGWLYEVSLGWLVAVVALSQVAALVLLADTVHGLRRRTRTAA